MKRLFLVLCFSTACTLIASAQTARTRVAGDLDSQASASAKQAGQSVTLDSGTHLSGELQNSIDARKVKVGDQVVLKTTQAIKSHGRTVVSKGSRLVGRITEVAQVTKGNAESRIGILFDRLEQGSLQMPIAATISSITGASVATNNEDMFAGESSATGSTRSSASTRSSGGGLLGGVGGVVNSTTSTAGGALGSATTAVGSTVNSTSGAVGSTASGVGRSLGGIRISESSNTSMGGSSVLSLQGQNLRLEKGTNFQIMLTQSATVGTR
jgi:hypothetical protein